MKGMEETTTPSSTPVSASGPAAPTGLTSASMPPGVPQRSDGAVAPSQQARPAPAAQPAKPAAAKAAAKKAPAAPRPSTAAKKAPRIEKGKPVDPAVDRLFPLPAIPDGADPELAAKAEDLRRWWVNQLIEEWPMVVHKAIEYGGGDLDLMGEGIGMMVGDEGPASGVEKALTFYLMGKVSRLLGAFQRKLRPSRDTWVDSHVYSMMGMRVHDEGHWF
jgi:hypothetical protein